MINVQFFCTQPFRSYQAHRYCVVSCYTTSRFLLVAAKVGRASRRSLNAIVGARVYG